MTKIKRGGKVERVVETPAGDLYVVTMSNEGLYLRVKGTRTTYGPLGWTGLMYEGAKRHADRLLLNKKPRRARRSALRVGL